MSAHGTTPTSRSPLEMSLHWGEAVAQPNTVGWQSLTRLGLGGSANPVLGTFRISSKICSKFRLCQRCMLWPRAFRKGVKPSSTDLTVSDGISMNVVCLIKRSEARDQRS